MTERPAVLRRADNHVSTSLDDCLVMMDIDAGKYYVLDDVASYVWTQLAEPTPVADLIDGLCSLYDVSPSQCEGDLLPFLDQLREKGLVQQA